MPPVRFLDQFDVVLLDMNGTFMFGHDRFGPTEDYFATYQAVGGTSLDRDALMGVMRSCFAGLIRIYEEPDQVDDIPSLAEAFRQFGGAPEADLPILERVFAAHELGRVPPENEAFLREIATTHRLGVVSNLFSHPSTWMDRVDTTGIFSVFATRVFSSEGRSIKPSPVIFRRAVDAFPKTARILFVGDSLQRDIVPAKALGLGTAWIAPCPSSHPAADVVIDRLPDLALVGVSRRL
jgi:putative hydrolase of the HAD superfamily/5'-nucleotidase